MINNSDSPESSHGIRMSRTIQLRHQLTQKSYEQALQRRRHHRIICKQEETVLLNRDQMIRLLEEALSMSASSGASIINRISNEENDPITLTSNNTNDL